MEATDQLAVMKKTRQQINFGSYTPKYTYNGQQRYERPSKQERDPNAMDIDAIRGLPKKGSIKCYNCGRIGHMSRNCTAPRKSFQKRGTPKNKGSLGKSSRKPPRKPKKHHARTQEIESEDSDDDKVIDYRIRCPIPRCRKPLQYDHVAYARGQTDVKGSLAKIETRDRRNDPRYQFKHRRSKNSNPRRKGYKIAELSKKHHGQYNYAELMPIRKDVAYTREHRSGTRSQRSPRSEISGG